MELITISQFLSISIVGVVLSGLIAWLKNALGTTGNTTKVLTAILACIVAGAFVWLQSTPYIQTVVTVLGVASTVFAFFIKK